MKRSMRKEKKKKTVAVSGGFDPIHVGHLRLFKAAKALGDRLVVILNNDNWLRMKKGFAFMPENERAEIIREFLFVDEVVITAHAENDPDRSVCRELERVRPDIFANGGDRRAEADIPEAAVCKRLGIEMIFNAGHGGKVSSSSNLAKAAARAIAKLRDVNPARRGVYSALLPVNRQARGYRGVDKNL